MIRFPDYIRKHAHHHPDTRALHFEGRDFTWAEFSDRLHGTAQVLSDLGLAPGDRVAYLGQNSHWMAELYFAPCTIGALFVPLNFRLSEQELAAVLADCTPDILVVDRHHIDTGARLIGHCASLRHLIVADWDSDGTPGGALHLDTLIAQARRPADDAFDFVATASDAPMALFYTSGTTGQPKGVMLSHRNLLANAMGTGLTLGFSPTDTTLLSGPLFHLGTGSRLYTSVVFGMAMVIQSRFDVVETARIIAEQKVTNMTLVPTMLRMVLDHPAFSEFDLSTLRLLTYGAAPMPLALLERAIHALPGVRYCQSYGMTEASPVVAVLAPADHVLGNPMIDKLSSVGMPLPYCDIRIIGESGARLSAMEPGEIIVRGPQIMSGYWNRPEATKEALRGGFYHTGDAGYLDHDGYLYLVGRTREMMITGGENVYPIETENCLSQHPAVAQAAVFGIPDQTWGEAVHAVVTLRDGHAATADDLIAFCRAHIARYKAPRAVTFWDEPLPLSATNKIDKTTIRAAVLARRHD